MPSTLDRGSDVERGNGAPRAERLLEEHLCEKQRLDHRGTDGWLVNRKSHGHGRLARLCSYRRKPFLPVAAGPRALDSPHIPC